MDGWQKLVYCWSSTVVSVLDQPQSGAAALYFAATRLDAVDMCEARTAYDAHAILIPIKTRKCLQDNITDDEENKLVWSSWAAGPFRGTRHSNKITALVCLYQAAFPRAADSVVDI